MAVVTPPGAVGLERYRIIAPVGKGTLGTVYWAEVVGADGRSREVALKVLDSEVTTDPDFLARLGDELRFIGMITHRSLVRAEGLAPLDGTWAIVTELVDGISLADVLRGGPIPIPVALDVIIQAASALHAAWHQLGPGRQPLHVLHRDLKPSNVLLTQVGEVRIVDFGLMRTASTGGGNPSVVDRRLASAARLYAAPECFRGLFSPASDVYSLGAVLFELVAGVPYGGADALDGPEARARRAAALLGALPAAGRDELAVLVFRMVAEEPSERPSAVEVERAAVRLRAALDGDSLAGWCGVAIPERFRGRVVPPDDHRVGKVYAVATLSDDRVPARATASPVTETLSGAPSASRAPIVPPIPPRAPRSAPGGAVQPEPEAAHPPAITMPPPMPSVAANNSVPSDPGSPAEASGLLPAMPPDPPAARHPRVPPARRPGSAGAAPMVVATTAVPLEAEDRRSDPPSEPLTEIDPVAPLDRFGLGARPPRPSVPLTPLPVFEPEPISEELADDPPGPAGRVAVRVAIGAFVVGLLAFAVVQMWPEEQAGRLPPAPPSLPAEDATARAVVEDARPPVVPSIAPEPVAEPAPPPVAVPATSPAPSTSASSTSASSAATSPVAAKSTAAAPSPVASSSSATATTTTPKSATTTPKSTTTTPKAAVSTSSSTGTPSSSASGADTPVKAAPAPVAATTGKVSVSGDALRVELESGGKRVAPGDVPAGTYTVYATFGDAPAVVAGTVTVTAGGTARVKCVADFAQCKSQ